MKVGDRIAKAAATLDHVVEVPVRHGIQQDLSQESRDRKALELANANVRLKEITRQRKDYINKTKDEKKELEGVVDNLSLQVKEGVERVPTDVVKHIDKQHMEIAYLDPTSRRVLEVRTLTAEELQKELSEPDQAQLHASEGDGNGAEPKVKRGRKGKAANGGAAAPRKGNKAGYDPGITHRCGHCGNEFYMGKGFDPTDVQECPSCHQRMASFVPANQADAGDTPANLP